MSTFIRRFDNDDDQVDYGDGQSEEEKHDWQDSPTAVAATTSATVLEAVREEVAAKVGSKRTLVDADLSNYKIPRIKRKLNDNQIHERDRTESRWYNQPNAEIERPEDAELRIARREESKRTADPSSFSAVQQRSAVAPSASQHPANSESIDQQRANKKSIERMLSSRRRHCIRFAADRGCFMFKDRHAMEFDPNPTQGEVTLVGLRDILRRVCFANYRYEEARDSGTGQLESQRIATGLKAAHHGSARGRDVHEQLSIYISKGEAFWKSQFGYGCSPYVLRIVKFLTERGLIPVAGEFQDFLNDCRIGSSIDILCEDTIHNGLCIIELKIGGENYFEKANAPLYAPKSLTNYGNSPRNQALLQLLVYRAMVTTNYPYVRVSRCYVLQVRTDAIVLYGLTRDFVNAQDELVAALVARRAFDIRRQTASTAQRARGSRRGRPWHRGGKV